MAGITRKRGKERVFFLFLAVAFLTAGLLSGCAGREDGSGGKTGSAKKKDSGKTQSTAPTQSPIAAPALKTGPSDSKVRTPEEAIAAVEACDDAFVLFALKSEWAQRGLSSETLEQAINKRVETLATGMTPRNLVPGLDYLAVDTECTGEKEYTFSILLKTTTDLNTDYHPAVLGFVFPSNVQYLPEAERQSGYATWVRILREEPTSQWKQGEYHVVRVKAEGELIPFNLRLSLDTRDAQGRWTATVGEQLLLGWQWAVADEASFIGKIEGSKDFAALYALAPPGPKLSAPIAEALARKWKTLTAGMIPKTIVEGLDILAVDTKATGEKEYTFSFLLRPTIDLNTDYHLSLTGAVDKSHLQYIQPAKPGGSYASWNLFLYNDPTSLWKVGEDHVAQLKIETKIIPFELSVSLQTRGAQRQWTGNPGKVVELGWQAAVPE